MKSVQELKALRDRVYSQVSLRVGNGSAAQAATGEEVNEQINIAEGSTVRKNVLVCSGTGCTSSRSPEILENFRKALEKFDLQDEVRVFKTGCFGLCQRGPIVVVYPDNVYYCHVKPEDVDEIAYEHLKQGNVIERLEMYDIDPETQEKILDIAKIPFYAKQMRIALKNCGVIDPENIEEYIAMDGYQALAKVLTEMTPDDVIDTMLAAGLRGRGGGGFPTGRKWRFAANEPKGQKYVICNADEGDPGAFMDRSIMEGDPHAIIEAMEIAGYAIGANHGYVYIRAEYPIAVERLKIAIKQAKEMGLLGKDIFGTGFDFDLEIRLGAGAFVCGEETALIASIEGQRGNPRNKPPFPAQAGVWGKPTIINNVETFANVAQIILKGADWFSSIGTEKSKGTKVFALGGKIVNTGLVEIPMGTTLREVIYEIGGGCPNGKRFKAVQTGGPSGGCLTEEELDVPIDYDNLTARGSMMGSGGMIVLDEDNCMVDVARFYMDFIVDESCGKCTPCRVGTQRLLEMLTAITEGRGTPELLEEMESLCEFIKADSLCGLGQTAPNPIQSTIGKFREEYNAHVIDKRCPAKVCKALLQFKIDPDKCRKCSLCAKACPVEAISGVTGKIPFYIDPDKCIKCGTCIHTCHFGAIERG